jgi:hypothetical protein
MSTTILALVQMFTDKGGLPRPAALVSATDKSARQYLSLLRETIADLGEYRWQQQRVRGTFTTVALALQGALPTLFGAGYAGLVKNSLWNDTRHMQIFGPVTDQTWNTLQALPTAGPEFQYWLSRDSLYISPTLEAGETVSAVYVTKYNVLDTDGVTYKELVDADTDTVLFPDNVVLRLFESKWKKQKGESGWQDDYNDAISLIAKNLVRDSSPTLSLDGRTAMPQPGVIIPPGSWGV